MSIDFDRIRRLVKLVEQNQLTELTVEEDDLNIKIKVERPDQEMLAMPVAQASTIVEVQPFPAAPESPPEPEDMSGGVDEECLFRITSPMVGVFYRRPSPDSPVYVDVGDMIEVGQTIGLIEAMKVFSEVPSEVAGRVVDIPAENAKLVQQGDILVVVDTSAES